MYSRSSIAVGVCGHLCAQHCSRSLILVAPLVPLLGSVSTRPQQLCNSKVRVYPPSLSDCTSAKSLPILITLVSWQASSYLSHLFFSLYYGLPFWQCSRRTCLCWEGSSALVSQVLARYADMWSVEAILQTCYCTGFRASVCC